MIQKKEYTEKGNFAMSKDRGAINRIVCEEMGEEREESYSYLGTGVRLGRSTEWNRDTDRCTSSYCEGRTNWEAFWVKNHGEDPLEGLRIASAFIEIKQAFKEAEEIEGTSFEIRTEETKIEYGGKLFYIKNVQEVVGSKKEISYTFVPGEITATKSMKHNPETGEYDTVVEYLLQIHQKRYEAGVNYIFEDGQAVGRNVPNNAKELEGYNELMTWVQGEYDEQERQFQLLEMQEEME